MSDQMSNGAEQQQASSLPMHVLAQYVKDLSFENPNAPQSLLPNQPQPQAIPQAAQQPTRLPNSASSCQPQLSRPSSSFHPSALRQACSGASAQALAWFSSV